MSALHASSKTPRRVLHTAAMEGEFADNQQGTGEAASITVLEVDAGAPHGRGEISTCPAQGSGRRLPSASAVAVSRREVHTQPCVLALPKDAKRRYPTPTRRVRHSLESGRTVEVTGKEHATRTLRDWVPADGSLTISTAAAPVQGVEHKHCTVLQRGDGYGYLWKEVAFASPPCTSLRTGFPNANE